MARAVPTPLTATLALIALASTSPAWSAVPAPVIAVPPAGPTAEEQVTQLQGEMTAARNEIYRLRTALTEAETAREALKTCEAKNQRIAAIGLELIDSYDKRYRKRHDDAFQLGRRKFETELQDKGDAIYRNQTSAVAPPASSPAPASPAGTAGTDTPQTTTPASPN